MAVARSALAAGGIALPFTGGIPIAFGIGGSDRDVLIASNTGLGRTIVDAAGAPPVPTDWREDLDRQARDVMSGSDRELLQARAPTRAGPRRRIGQNDDIKWPPPGGGGGGGGFTGAGLVGRVPRSGPG